MLIFTTALVFGLYIASHITPVVQKIIKKTWLAWLISIVLAVLLFMAVFSLRGLLLGFAGYTFLIIVALDIVRLFLFLFFKNTAAQKQFKKYYFYGLPAMALSVLLCAVGYINVQSTAITSYSIDAAAYTEEQPLKIAMISDLHIGSFVTSERVKTVVDIAAGLQPDMVLLVGDIFVEETTEQQRDLALLDFQTLSEKTAIYYVPGNHEYYGGGLHNPEQNRGRLMDAGITLLRDETLQVNGITLVGREDASRVQRAPVSDLMQEEGFTIVLDHQPRELIEASAAGADLLLCGHTHAGQLFPVGQLAELLGINKMNYGHRKIGETDVIVSSGAGLWGIPMRVGSFCEIVEINIA